MDTKKESESRESPLLLITSSRDSGAFDRVPPKLPASRQSAQKIRSVYLYTERDSHKET